MSDKTQAFKADLLCLGEDEPVYIGAGNHDPWEELPGIPVGARYEKLDGTGWTKVSEGDTKASWAENSPFATLTTRETTAINRDRDTWTTYITMNIPATLAYRGYLVMAHFGHQYNHTSSSAQIHLFVDGTSVRQVIHETEDIYDILQQTFWYLWDASDRQMHTIELRFKPGEDGRVSKILNGGIYLLRR